VKLRFLGLVAIAVALCSACTKTKPDCQGNAVMCGSTCVDRRSDNQNCGACGNACASGLLCSSGACVLSCPGGLVNCGGTCVDPQTDRTFCGATGLCTGLAAGATCAAGEICSAGQCALSCQAGLVDCGGKCVDPQTDRTWCGASGTCTGAGAGVTCAAGEVCSGGACGLSCQAGLLDCGGKCIDPKSDQSFCGASGTCTGPAAGVSCAGGDVCSNGTCALSCQAGLVNCSGTCVDPLTDRAFCGAKNQCFGPDAGTVCAAGEVCSNGTCAVSCQAGLVDCGGKCVDPLTDRAFCGASGSCTGAQAGAICAAGDVCSGGTCAVTCAAGLVDCGGKCIDPLTDRSFCGASNTCTGPEAGATCAAGFVCDAGACKLSCQGGLVNCGGTCVDPATDGTYCGASGSCTGPSAGTTCASGQVCSGGTCAVTCQAGLVLCGGSCVDPSTSRAHCGATADCAGPNAGTACGSRDTCSGGTCTTICPVGQLICNSVCVDPTTSLAFCGATADCTGPNAGVACRPSSTCQPGTNPCPCNPGLVDCNGTCATSCAASTTCAVGQTTGCSAVEYITPSALSPFFACVISGVGNGSYYNNCAGNYTLTFTDTVGLVPVSIQLQFTEAVACAGGTETVALNGTTFGTYDREGQCTCTSSTTPATISSTAAGALAAFAPGGTNTFRFSAISACEGFHADAQGFLARVVLTY
jgi:hypothetical protein